jgi:tryptophan halogenase
MALQEDRNIRRITIVGGGTSGYLAVFRLCKQYPNINFTWVFPEDNDPIGVGEALVPSVSNFFKDVGITHADIIKHCNGTLKLGIKFENFNQVGESFTFPFGIGESTKFNTSSIDRIMSTESIPHNMLDYPDISAHCRTTETLAYMDTLVGQFTNLTIKRERASKEQLIGTYDLLIDSTGFGRHISGKPNNHKSISNLIPNNRALIFRHPYTDLKFQLKPYSTFTAMEHGWIWNIPLGDQLAMGYVHWDKFDVKDEFINYIQQKMHIKVNPEDINTIPMVTGRNIVHLEDNIVPIGLASAFIEPLESTGLYLVVSQLDRLCDYINGTITADEYNTQVNDSYDRIANFIAAHYKYSKRTNEYWDFYKTVDIENFKTMDIFPHEAWEYILSGFDTGIARPKDTMDPHTLLDIHRGTPYYKWLENESNFT